ncbi:nickel pincer cofactor biosynthesis protein LarB [Poriferisphaera sp. WC338]|uniref:nickel pincer cofactor biosynthesis protein LarB n=1 Tax=Poriferisphaera sp. WC338 TaxID=3425129 RepID=UPI003D81363A
MTQKPQNILQSLIDGNISIPQALDQLTTHHQTESLGYANIDHHRATRCGSPEVIFAQQKTSEQVVTIAQSILNKHSYVLITRCNTDHLTAINQSFADTPINIYSTTVLLGSPPAPSPQHAPIPIICAGTSDLPVADEAHLTCQSLLQSTISINDVGVAGIHRLTPHLETLRSAHVLIVIAGMEGALPSVIGGLVDIPVIAVPTSVGYGTSFAGITPLLAMLNSCASGITVVNIDNGFGAAHAASLINRQIPRK